MLTPSSSTWYTLIYMLYVTVYVICYMLYVYQYIWKDMLSTLYEGMGLSKLLLLKQATEQFRDFCGSTKVPNDLTHTWPMLHQLYIYSFCCFLHISIYMHVLSHINITISMASCTYIYVDIYIYIIYIHMYNFDPPLIPAASYLRWTAPFPLTVTPQHRDDAAPEAQSRCGYPMVV